MASYAKKTASGSYEVFQNDQRVATGAKDILGNYGLSETNLGSAPTAQNAPAPASTGVPGENANRNYNFGPDAPATSAIPTPTPAPSGVTAPAIPQPQAPAIQGSYVTSVAGEAARAKQATESAYAARIKEIDQQREETKRKISGLEDKQDMLLDTDVEPLTKPFREELENTERDRLHINENFEANQGLIRELEGLLTEGNEMIRGERSRFASRASVAAGVARTMEDVAARTGVIQAVMAARSGQIAEAERMIDRSVEAISADRQDRLNYYNTILNLYETRKDDEGQKLLKLDDEKKTYVAAQIQIIQDEMKRTQKTADDIKAAMLDPDKAQAYAQAGITLNDTPETISQKLATYAYQKEIKDISNNMAKEGYSYLLPGQSAPAGAHVVTTTDTKGEKRTYYKMPSSTSTSGGGYAGGANVGAPSTPASGLTGQQIITAARGLRYSSVAESSRIIGDVTSFVNAGDLKGAEDVLRQFGYQKLPVSTQQDYDLYDNARSAFEAVSAQLETTSLKAGPYKALAENAKPWLLMGRDKQYAELRAVIEQGQAQLRKGYYGTAVTGTEAGNAKNFLVNDNDDIDTIRWKASQGAAFLQFVNDAQIARAVGLPRPDLATYLTPENEDLSDDALQQEYDRLSQSGTAANDDAPSDVFSTKDFNLGNFFNIAGLKVFDMFKPK